MNLVIIAPGKQVFNGEVSIVTFPGVDGFFQILNQHAPLVSLLGKGSITYQTEDGQAHHLNITGGIVEVKNNLVQTLVDSITLTAPEAISQ